MAAAKGLEVGAAGEVVRVANCGCPIATCAVGVRRALAGLAHARGAGAGVDAVVVALHAGSTIHGRRHRGAYSCCTRPTFQQAAENAQKRLTGWQSKGDVGVQMALIYPPDTLYDRLGGLTQSAAEPHCTGVPGVGRQDGHMAGFEQSHGAGVSREQVAFGFRGFGCRCLVCSRQLEASKGQHASAQLAKV